MKLAYSIFFIIFLTSQVILNAQWEKTNGPGGRGGYIYSVHTDGNKIYAASSGGTYFSENGGMNWERFFRADTLSLIPVPSFRSIGTNGNTIYAAYGDVYKSSDNGSTWVTILHLSSVFGGIEKIAVSGNWIVAIAGGSVYQSTDGGSSWNMVDSARGRTLSMKDSICITEESISTDYGRTWKNLQAEFYRNHSEVSFNNSNLLISMRNYVFSSSDFGKTWSADSIVLNCRYISSLKHINNYVFAGTDTGIFRSSDNGLSWVRTSNGLPPIFVNSISYIENPNPVILAGTSAGIYRSSDMGETWEAIGVPAGDWKLASSDSVIFAGASFDLGTGTQGSTYLEPGTEIYKSTDNGLSWLRADYGFPHSYFNYRKALNSNSLTSLYLSSDKVFASIFLSQNMSGEVYSSEDGMTWSKIFPDSVLRFQLYLSENSSQIFLGTYHSGGLFNSTNQGNTWNRVNTGIKIEGGFGNEFEASYQYFTYNNGRVFAGGHSYIYTGFGDYLVKNYVLSSSAIENNWEILKLEPALNFAIQNSYDTTSSISDICVIDSHLVIGTRFYQNEPGGGIYHYIFNGTEWVLSNTKFLGESINDLLQYRSVIFAATRTKGIFKSTDFGETWIEINEGLGDKTVSSLSISNDYFFAATPSGVYKRLLSEITSVYRDNPNEIPETFSLEQNYPNPFNPATTIKYSIPEPGFISLKIYNMLGEEVAILFDGFQQTGNYSVKFNAANLSSGVYLYRLKGENYIETKKLLLLK